MHPSESIIQTTMSRLREIVDVNTVVGKPIYAENNTVIVPVSKVSFGFCAGGAEFTGRFGKPAKGDALRESALEAEGNYPFAGNTVAGVSVTPKAFVCLRSGQPVVLPVECGSTLDRLVDLIPQVLNEINKTVDALHCDKSKANKDGAADTREQK